jgi:ATP-binding cassette subfamily C (CFTR/MRP) protein 1
MIARVLSAPINLFFDVTPIGRIINRFSKDMDVVDTELSYWFGGVFDLFFVCIQSIIV